MTLRCRHATVLVVPLLALLAACGEAPDATDVPVGAGAGDAAPASREAPPPRSIHLTDVTDASGIDLRMTSGTSPSREILEVNGGGLALLDYDRDGDLDLFVANGATMAAPEDGPGSKLYRNDGALRFTDVTTESGIDLRRWAMGVAAGDVDGDGWDDLFVCCYGPNVLLRNTGDGRFEDATAAAGVGDERWASSAAFGDLDNDGDLDLYVVNYVVFDAANPPPRAFHKGVSVMNGPHGLPGEHDVLYVNDGAGVFRDVTVEANVLPARPAFGLNLVIVDFDRDGRQDVLVGNDSMANFYHRNVTAEPDVLRFEEVGMRTGLASNMDGSNQATMGIALADVDGNGLPDVFSTNFANDTNTLHLNLDGLFFDDRTHQYGLGMISRPFLGWATVFLDLDHDGDEDLLSFNGHVYPEATEEAMDSAYEQPPLLFERAGRRFERVQADVAGAWLARSGRDRCAAVGDLDRDGDVDVVVGGINEPVRVLRNDAARAGVADWLVVTLEDGRSGVGNRHGIGARIELAAGGVTQTRWVHSGAGFQSSSSFEVHFGVPGGTTPERLVVDWPDGHRQEIAAPTPGQRLVVRR